MLRPRFVPMAYSPQDETGILVGEGLYGFRMSFVALRSGSATKHNLLPRRLGVDLKVHLNDTRNESSKGWRCREKRYTSTSRSDCV